MLNNRLLNGGIALFKSYLHLMIRKSTNDNYIITKDDIAEHDFSSQYREEIGKQHF